ncbi:hypothetical protein [Enterococcus sp. BWR-S5]|uniref:hypothetical protein n=1 Tax=Enterococcus sp. BWR-S5 TaxID=2787714 RepID=UPI001920BE75|nr:hypothetical protein [Enterococcus sp. BWR-S5]MBL1227220.1 hypothetical protein [Enterococcus sp. BWR-S5]
MEEKKMNKNKNIMIGGVVTLSVGVLAGAGWYLSEQSKAAAAEKKTTEEIKKTEQTIEDDLKELSGYFDSEQLSALQSSVDSEVVEKIQNYDKKASISSVIKGTKFENEHENTKLQETFRTKMIEEITYKYELQRDLNAVYNTKDGESVISGTKVQKSISIKDDVKKEDIDKIVEQLKNDPNVKEGNFSATFTAKEGKHISNMIAAIEDQDQADKYYNMRLENLEGEYSYLEYIELHPEQMKTAASENFWYKNMTDLANQAVKQAEQVSTAKEKVLKVYKEKVISTDTKLYDEAKKAVDSLHKDSKLKKDLSDQLTKVKTEIDKKKAEQESKEKETATGEASAEDNNQSNSDNQVDQPTEAGGNPESYNPTNDYTAGNDTNTGNAGNNSYTPDYGAGSGGSGATGGGSAGGSTGGGSGTGSGGTGGSGTETPQPPVIQQPSPGNSGVWFDSEAACIAAKNAALLADDNATSASHWGAIQSDGTYKWTYSLNY